MNDHDRLGTGRDATLQIIGIHAEHIVDVAEYRGCAEVDCLRNASPIGLRGTDDLVAFAETDRKHRGGQRHRAVAICDRVIGSLPSGKFILEFFRDVRAGECASANNVHCRILRFLGQNHLTEKLVKCFRGNRSLRDRGGAAKECQFFVFHNR